MGIRSRALTHARPDERVSVQASRALSLHISSPSHPTFLSLNPSPLQRRSMTLNDPATATEYGFRKEANFYKKCHRNLGKLAVEFLRRHDRSHPDHRSPVEGISDFHVYEFGFSPGTFRPLFSPPTPIPTTTYNVG